eukprot:TRINITY_DN11503_c0_g4_i1.p1 TRINITY_DN11503_c0_g4~~TRINITY_DN11503_c0_g4_i1.p1  ORF type:complete len:850 (-),score=198.47 TRINITY_DN11503_c0_g4_i1:246-2795(-)
MMLHVCVPGLQQQVLHLRSGPRLGGASIGVKPLAAFNKYMKALQSDRILLEPMVLGKTNIRDVGKQPSGPGACPGIWGLAHRPDCGRPLPLRQKTATGGKGVKGPAENPAAMIRRKHIQFAVQHHDHIIRTTELRLDHVAKPEFASARLAECPAGIFNGSRAEVHSRISVRIPGHKLRIQAGAATEVENSRRACEIPSEKIGHLGMDGLFECLEWVAQVEQGRRFRRRQAEFGQYAPGRMVQEPGAGMVDRVEQSGLPIVFAYQVQIFDRGVRFPFLFPLQGVGHHGCQVVLGTHILAQVERDRFFGRQPCLNVSVQQFTAEVEACLAGPGGPVSFEEHVGDAQAVRVVGQFGEQDIRGQFLPVGIEVLIEKQGAIRQRLVRDRFPHIVGEQAALVPCPEFRAEVEALDERLALAVGVYDTEFFVHGRLWNRLKSWVKYIASWIAWNRPPSNASVGGLQRWGEDVSNAKSKPSIQGLIPMKNTFKDALNAIRPVDRSLAAQGQAHLDNLTKPLGSLGRLEELALQIFLIQDGQPLKVDPMRVYTVAGDHGVNEEGVSPFPQEVTRQMVLNFLADGAGINVLAKTVGAELFVVDAGCCGGPFDDHPSLIQAKVAPGTANLAQGPAMTRDQCLQALLLGISLADHAHADGVKVLGTGEMGISNTTPSTALYSAFLGLEPEIITGPGAGLDKSSLPSKVAAIRRGLAVNKAAVDSGDAVAILAALGGLEIAALAGLILGGAKNRQLVCVDGFISTAAYLAAWKLCPDVADYCILSHASAEPGYSAAVKAMGLDPYLHLGFRLGEGTGAACAMFLVRAAANIYNEMATFASAGVSEGQECLPSPTPPLFLFPD